MYWLVQILYKIFVIVLVLLLLPLGAILALLIFLTSGPPVFYLQRRIGKNNKPLVLYKFRTMTVGAEKQQAKLERLNEANGPVFKIRDDPRFTRLGKFLSHTGLDELPQLVNILKGEMALVGPRPLPVAEAAKLKPWQKKRHAISPGLISPWILEGYHSKPFAAWMKSDILYIQQKSFWYDTSLIFRTGGLLAKIVRQKIVDYMSGHS